jgi:hypothetical protein
LEICGATAVSDPFCEEWRSGTFTARLYDDGWRVVKRTPLTFTTDKVKPTAIETAEIERIVAAIATRRSVENKQERDKQAAFELRLAKALGPTEELKKTSTYTVSKSHLTLISSYKMQTNIWFGDIKEVSHFTGDYITVTLWCYNADSYWLPQAHRPEFDKVFFPALNNWRKDNPHMSGVFKNQPEDFPSFAPQPVKKRCR